MNADNWEYGTGQIFFRDALGLLYRAHGPYDTVTTMVTKLLRANLTIIDDIGMLPETLATALVDRSCTERTSAKPPESLST